MNLTAPVAAAAPPKLPVTPSPVPAPGAPASGAVPGAAGKPGVPAAPADAAAARAAALDTLMKTSALDAIGQATGHLDKVATLTVGGGTPDGAKAAQTATALLTDASMLLQHAHVKTIEQLHGITAELHMRLMGSASGLAYMGGQIAVAGSAKQPIKLAEIAAKPIAETKSLMADVVKLLAPDAATGAATNAAPAPAAPAPAAPAPAHAAAA